MHEMSHTLGFEHSGSLDLMYPTLLPGERRFLNEQQLAPQMGQYLAHSSSDAVDSIFGSTSDDNKKWMLT